MVFFNEYLLDLLSDFAFIQYQLLFWSFQNEGISMKFSMIYNVQYKMLSQFFTKSINLKNFEYKNTFKKYSVQSNESKFPSEVFDTVYHGP